MAVPNPKDWLPGEELTSVTFNTEIRDSLNFMLNPPSCSAGRATDVSIPTGAPWSAVALNFEHFDSTNTMHSTSTNPSRIIAPEAGLYMVTAQCGWSNTSGAGARGVAAGVNGGGTFTSSDVLCIQQAPATVSGVSTIFNVSAAARLLDGDYVELFCYQSSGANLALNISRIRLTVTWMGK